MKLAEILLSGKFYKDGDGGNYDEVKDGEFVHFLAHAGLPTLSKERRVNETSKNTQHWMGIHSQEQISLLISFTTPAASSQEVNYNKAPVDIVVEWRKRPHRVKQMVVATIAGPLFTCDLGPEREQQNPDAGQPHEHTPVRTGWRGKSPRV